MNKEIKLVKQLLEAQRELPFNKYEYYVKQVIFDNKQTLHMFKVAVMFGFNNDRMIINSGNRYILCILNKPIKNLNDVNVFNYTFNNNFNIEDLIKGFNFNKELIEIEDQTFELKYKTYTNFILFDFPKDADIYYKKYPILKDSKTYKTLDYNKYIIYDLNPQLKGNKKRFKYNNYYKRSEYTFYGKQENKVFYMVSIADKDFVDFETVRNLKPLGYYDSTDVLKIALDIDKPYSLEKNNEVAITPNYLIVGKNMLPYSDELKIIKIKRNIKKYKTYELSAISKDSKGLVLNKKNIFKPKNYKEIDNIDVEFHVVILGSLLEGLYEIQYRFKRFKYYDDSFYEYDDEDLQLINHKDSDFIEFPKDFYKDFIKTSKDKIKQQILNDTDMDDYWESEDINEMRNDDVDDISVGRQANEYAEELKQKYKNKIKELLNDDTYYNIYIIKYDYTYTKIIVTSTKTNDVLYTKRYT